MIPAIADGIDVPVNSAGQWIATVLTFGLAAAVLTWVAIISRHERIAWPWFVLISGTLTCLMEPLFDHLYGLRFLEKGQWQLYTTFDSPQPIWVPAAYLAFYGGATVFIARRLTRHPSKRTVWSMYGAIVVMAIAAEMTYVSVLGVYVYQDSQPFVVLGYPIFLGFTNATSTVVSGILVFRLRALLPSTAQPYLIPIVPMAFAAGLFGCGIVYLSVRHSVDRPPMLLVHVAALTVVAGIASTVDLLGRLLVAPVTEDVAANLAEDTVADHSRLRPPSIRAM